jgi:hypothetical protein
LVVSEAPLVPKRPRVEGLQKGDVARRALVLSCIALGYSVPSTVPYAGIGFLLAMSLSVSTALFNRPKLLVPPRLRGEVSFWRDRPASCL